MSDRVLLWDVNGVAWEAKLIDGLPEVAYLNHRPSFAGQVRLVNDHGSVFWFLDDERHRLDGPAAEYTNGTRRWYVNGVKFSEQDYPQAVAEFLAGGVSV